MRVITAQSVSLDICFSLSTAICHAPVYVYPHSKFVLMQAIMADSEFLAQNSIMDYSLLTCIDDNAGMLVVGIIGKVNQSNIWLIAM